MQKAQADISQHQVNGVKSSHVRDSTVSGVQTLVASGRLDGEADDDASTKGMSSPVSDTEVNPTQSELNISQIPTIKISSESDREQEVGDTKPDADSVANVTTAASPSVASQELEKPLQAAAGDDTDKTSDTNGNPTQEGFSFSNKRLCERWLDNLFMVLYEVRSSSNIEL